MGRQLHDRGVRRSISRLASSACAIILSYTWIAYRPHVKKPEIGGIPVSEKTMDLVVEFLVRRADRPLGWSAGFAVMGVAMGFAKGVIEADPEGALIEPVVGGIVGGMVGLMFGIAAWTICRAMGGLDSAVQRPDHWGHPMVCPSCGWRTEREGPVSRRDCLIPPGRHRCSHCNERLVRLAPPACPECGSGDRKQIRYPGDPVWVALRCKDCGCSYDKWGEEIERTESEARGR
jgi:hypothetical protein